MTLPTKGVLYFLIALVIAVLGILLAKLITTVDREGLTTPPKSELGSGFGSSSSFIKDSGPQKPSTSPLQAVEEVYANIQDDFVRSMATSLAAIRLQDLGYPTQQQFQDDLKQRMSELTIYPSLSRENILGYYQQLTDAAIEYNTSQAMDNYASTLKEQLPLQVRSVVSRAISNYDSKIASFMNSPSSVYTSTFL
jgi:hypothetical protein